MVSYHKCQLEVVFHRRSVTGNNIDGHGIYPGDTARIVAWQRSPVASSASGKAETNENYLFRCILHFKLESVEDLLSHPLVMWKVKKGYLVETNPS